MPRLSKLTLFWHAVRIFIYAMIVKKTKGVLKLDKRFEKHLVLAALLFGTVIHQVISKLWDKFVCYLWNMKTLGPFDEFFLYDDPSSLANVMCVNFFSKFDGKSMQQYLKKSIQDKVP